MRFVLSRAGLLVFSVTLALVCGCEEHHPGELPEVQRDRLAEPRPPAAGERRTAPPALTVTPSPANFFPEQSPH